MSDKKKAFLYLHVAVFLFGFTAILGDLININFISIVWWRSMLTALFLAIIINLKSFFFTLSPKIFLQQILIGFFLAIHWLFFYGSIKVSNPTMALIALSSSSLMTAVLEPLIIKSNSWRKVDIILGILIIPGFLLIFYNSDNLQQKGLWLGLIGTFLGVIFSILNKKWLIVGQEFKLTFIQMFTVFLVISILFGVFSGVPDFRFEPLKKVDWFYMSVFVLLCTVLSYYLYLKSMKHINAFDVSVAFNMEPIYGIAIAALLLQDYKQISVLVYIGMVYITALVFLDIYLKFKKTKKI